MLPSPSSSPEKLIRWSVKSTRVDPETRARVMVTEESQDGTVLVWGGGGKGDDHEHKKGARVSPPRGPDRLKFSVILRLWEEAGSSIQLMRLIAPFAASEGIRKDTGIITWVRWPNRVVIGERTVATATLAVVVAAAGLPDMAPKASHDPPKHIILTFEVNVRDPLADEVGRKGGADACDYEDHEDDPTSLYDALGVDVDQSLLLEKILESLAWMHLGWRRGMNDQIVRRVKSMVETVGRRVMVVDGTGRDRIGYAKDIDGFGRLVVELEGGGERDCRGRRVTVESGLGKEEEEEDKVKEDDCPVVRFRELPEASEI